MKNQTFIICCFIILLLPGFTGAVEAGNVDEKGRKKFQVELFGGYTTLNPEDLNSRPNTHEQGIKFWNDDYYAFSVNVGYINSFSTEQSGGFKTIDNGAPFGFRFKYYLSKPLSLSFGVKYLSRSAASYVRHEYSIIERNGLESTYMVDWKPLNISAKGFTPMLGIHFEKALSKVVGLEIYVTGGPLFSRCRIEIDCEGESTYDGMVLDHDVWEADERGKGVGYAFDGGLRFNVKIGENIALFIEGGYAYQVVNKLSGPGYENRNGEVTEWKGDWGMKEYYFDRYWGTIDLSVASSYWEGGDEYLWVKGFSLNLSGLQARVGISYRF